MKLTDEQVQHLQSLEDRLGRITPDAVVEDAKQKNSPLHGLFEWDKGKAALAWWRETAREVIASVRLVVTTRQVSVPSMVYVRDPDMPGDEQGYRRVELMKRDPNMAREALIAELTRAAGYVNRCRSLALTLGLEAEVDGLMERIVGLQNMAEFKKSA